MIMIYDAKMLNNAFS